MAPDPSSIDNINNIINNNININIMEPSTTTTAPGAAAAAVSGGGAPLRKWIECEVEHHYQMQQQEECDEKAFQRVILLRATTIAYGIAELLRHMKLSSPQSGTGDNNPASATSTSVTEHCTIDNFIVREYRAVTGNVSLSVGDQSSSESNELTTTLKGDDIHGVDMISTGTSVNIFEPYFLRCGVSDYGNDQEDPTNMGRYLEVDFRLVHSHLHLQDADDCGSAAAGAQQVGSICEEVDTRCCHSLGVLLHKFFHHLAPSIRREQEESFTTAMGMVESGMPRTEVDDLSQDNEGDDDDKEEPAQKKSSITTTGNHSILLQLGYPSSICLLVQNLLRCEEGENICQYDSLDAVIKDLHLMLLDPSRFLFDNEPSLERGSMQLLFREHKLYGRENEVSVITDAFCRVSSESREALFIGGFSGSGKTRLVNSLTARVDVAGGYVITHTFDQMSKDRPLLAVIAVFNQLCLLIQEKNYQRSQAIVKELLQAFDSEISLLGRLLPNFFAMCPELKASQDDERNDHVTLRSMCFTLRRFLRVVSSKTHPVVLFLDDLQWCDTSSLTVVESILCDSIKSNSFFFVGSYRSNEVAEDHGIFHLINNLRTFGVPTTTVVLEGLNPADLNTMISDALCIFPRMCVSLSNIVHTKTKGNPLFVLEFLRSLVDGKLLNYSLRKRRWVWDEVLVNGVEITDNVLFLLTSKMSRLPNNIQSALKVGACFGLKIEEPVVSILSATPDYSNILRDLEQVVEEGFMVKIGPSEFKFVHDKVQEAAYSLVPHIEKNKFHYSLGMLLYSMSKKVNKIDGIEAAIADQINYDIDQLSSESPELRIEIANINELAGLKARDSSDHVRSSSYFTCAMSLLPTDSWKIHYEISLRVSFLLAESFYVRGESAEGILAEILEECRSFEDKLPAIFLLVAIHFNNQKLGDAFSICYDALAHRGEYIPQSLNPRSRAIKLIEETSKMVERISYGDLIAMKEMDNELRITMKLYNFITTVAFFSKPDILPFLVHRMIQLTMEYGFCKYSTMGFVNYAKVLCSSSMAKKNILSASRLGKAALSCSKKRCHSSDQLPYLYCVYYGFVAVHTEPLQSCADMLQKGFETALAHGDIGAASANSVQCIRTLIMAGGNLSSLLVTVNYHLELSTTYQSQTGIVYHTIYRETISTLIDKGGSTNPEHRPEYQPAEDANANIVEAMYFHRAIQAYWLGHSERCLYFADKFFQMSSNKGKLNGIVMTFINGLVSFQLLKRQNSAKLQRAGKKATTELKAAASNSSWNFSNKVHLLQAEAFSLQDKNEEAAASYTSAIWSAQFSRFVHEQGLACELAAHHYKKFGDHTSAASYFNQAKQCYVQWGSQMKVDIITRELSLLQIANCSDGDALNHQLVD